jgi:hypothetical protein
VALGPESPIVWDHHAFLGLGEGRFAVPASTWEPVETQGCDAATRAELEAQVVALERRINETTDQAQVDALFREIEAIWSDPCVNQMLLPVTTIVEMEVADGALRVVSRTEVRSDNPGERVLRGDDAWVVYATREVVIVPDGGTQERVPLT